MSNPVVPDPIGVKGEDATTVATVANPVPVDLTKVGAVAVTLGQKISALSMPVVLSAEQEAILVASAASLVTIGSLLGTASTANQGTPNAGGALAWPTADHGVVDDVATVVGVEGVPAPVRMTAQRAKHVNLRTAAGVELGTAAAPLVASAPDVVLVDTGNSTASFAVSIATPFIGTARDLTANGGWQAITDNIVQTTAGTAGTKFFEFSTDGTVWDISIPTDLTGQAFVIPLPLATVMKFYRTRIVATTATPFTIKLQTLLHRTAPPDLTQLPSQNMSATTPLKNVRSLLHGERFKAGVSQGFGNNPSNEAGSLITADFLTEVAKSNVPGHRLLRKMGYNNDVDAAAAETISRIGIIYPFPAAAAVLSVVSASALDVAVSVTIRGLDATFTEVEQTVITTGIVPVLTTQTFLRVNECFLSVTTNVGTITVTHLGAPQFTILADGTNQGTNTWYTIPAGVTGYLTEVVVGLVNGANTAGRGRLMVREDASVATNLLRLRDNYPCHSSSGQVTSDFKSPLRFPQRSDIRLDMSVDANNTEATGGFSLLLVNN